MPMVFMDLAWHRNFILVVRKLHQLSSAQMALLIGVIKGPSYYDPWRQPRAMLKNVAILVLQA